jgi:hypothetical protein
MTLANAPGTICLPTAEIGRFTLFTVCLASTQQPLDSNLGISASASVVENMNEIIRGLRPQDEWVWIIGDDHTWQPDCLLRLLRILDANPDIDILVPLVTKRNPPWHLVVFKNAGHDPIRDVPQWQPIPWEDVPESGTFEIDAAGSAGMLVRRQVLDTMGEPWFHSTNGTYLNEDVVFCQKATKLGFSIHATADVVMGHIGIFNVRPMQRDGRWGAMTEFSSPEEQFREIFMPPEPELVTATVKNGR